jgi:dTDP-4-dehydrorhamnose reductase
MRVLVTGARGQLGRDVVRACEEAGDEVVAADRSHLDITNRDAVLGSVLATRPQTIVHCAAWTAVDLCESDPTRAFTVNALAVRWIAEAARRSDAHLVLVSTDYVFDGAQPEPYTEWDEPAPLTVYGRSKLAGEREAVIGAPGATVVRTSWLSGEHGPNMVKTVLRLARTTPVLSFVDDQRGHPTFAADLAPVLRRFALDRRPGVYHVTNQGAVSWFEFVAAVLAAAGEDPGRVKPISTAELDPPRPAPRPANSVLDNAALRAAGLPLLDDFHEPLARLVKALSA